MVSISLFKVKVLRPVFPELIFTIQFLTSHIFLAGQLSCYPFRIKVMASKLACQCKDDITGKVLAGKKSSYI